MNNLSFTDINVFVDWVEHQKRFSPKVSLDKMRYFLHKFGDPHTKFKSIHVTGTNGKGSVVAYLRSVLITAGFNVATFTSPYITCFNERICHNNEMISDTDVLSIANEIVTKYDEFIDEGHELPTFFEFITIMAFIYYARIKDLDIAIIEVGMGGLLDSTNVITPLVSVITNVTLEHTKVLGDTIEEISLHKLGIVKDNVPLVTSNHNEILRPIFKKVVEEKKTVMYETPIKEVEILKQDIYSTQIRLNDLSLTIGLAGNHQIDNALCALLTLNILKTLDNKWKNALTNEIYYRGFKDVVWQGRLEIVNDNPLIILDGCHNIDGVLQVTNFIKGLDYKKKRVIVSISNDKNKKEMLAMISQTFDEIIITKYAYKRSADDEELFNLLEHPNKLIIPSVNEAIKYCFDHASDMTIFLGSLYLVSEVRNILKPLK